MKTTLQVLLLYCVCSFQLYSQQPLNANFVHVSNTVCPFDSAQPLTLIDNWLIYQTLNDRWDGPVDSSKCIGILPDVSLSYKIDLSQIDPAKPLFIKSLLDDDTKVLLESDLIYNFNGGVFFSANTPLNLSADCENDLCSGIIAGIEIPNASGDSTDLRIHSARFKQVSACENVSTCITTEKFDENYLKEVIFKLTFDSLNLLDVSLYPYNTYMEYVYNYGILDDIIYAYDNDYSPVDSTYYLDFWSLPGSFTETIMVPYLEPGYPSTSNISYHEVTLNENEPEPQNIKLTIDEWENLVFQPFTSFLPGFVEGSDSVRHNFILENNGGSICFSFVEFNFGGNDRFVYNGGEVDFATSRSCLQFMKGGKLIVGDNTTFHYGQNGSGMLVLRQGGTIEIGKNSTMIVDADMRMFEVHADESHQIYMNLNEGSTLKFSKYASLRNDYSINDEMKLNVYMNGGILDDSQLSPEERKLIKRIYPEEKETNPSDSFLYPNPANNYSLWNYHAKVDGEVLLEILDTNGRVVQIMNQNVVVGANQIVLDLRETTTGCYFLKWKAGSEEGSEKLMKL